MKRHLELDGSEEKKSVAQIQQIPATRTPTSQFNYQAVLPFVPQMSPQVPMAAGVPLSNNDILSWLFDSTWLMENNPMAPGIQRQPIPVESQFSYDNSSLPAPAPPPTQPAISNILQYSPSAPARLSSIPSAPGPPLPGDLLSYPLVAAYQDSNVFLYDNPLEDLPSTGPHSISLSHTTQSSLPLTDSPNSVSFMLKPIPEYEPISVILARHAAEGNTPQNKAWYVNDDVVLRMEKSLFSHNPHDRQALKEVFSESLVLLSDRILYFLFTYWQMFHKPFPFVHKPLFDTTIADPLLLSAMVVVGCHFGNPHGLQRLAKERRKLPEFELALMIATPLRYCLFQHADFSPPTKLWVLQALLILEFCEKNFLTRKMHERAHIHHSTTAQLLKRLPTFGGNPASRIRQVKALGNTSSADESDHEGTGSEDNLFSQWVELELMKRVTYMACYIDVVDFIKFRHDPAILFIQMQAMKMPCDSEVWELLEFNGLFSKVVKRQRRKHRRSEPFMQTLKKLLKPGLPINFDRNIAPLNSFVLLDGLIALMNQMKETDSQNQLLNHMDIKVLSMRWRDILCRAFDRWYMQAALPRTYSYHLSQIMGMSDINHYDIAIYGGSPANQLVRALQKDYELVSQKLAQMWNHPVPQPITKALIGDKVNFRALIHCYWLIWQLFDGHRPQVVTWNLIDNESMWAVLTAILVLWCYIFSTKGPELQRYEEIDPKLLEEILNCQGDALDEICSYIAEPGFAHIERIQEEFIKLLRQENLESYAISVPFERSRAPLHDRIDKYTELLPRLTNINHFAGVCFTVGPKLLGLQSEVIRENARLIIHCGLRLIGKPEVMCDSVFDNEFSSYH